MTNQKALFSRLKSVDSETVKAALRRSGRFAAYSSGIPKRVNRKKFQGQKDVLFLWIPKSAGTSIYNWLHEEIGMLKLKEPFAVKGGFPGCGPVTFGHMDLSLLIERNLVEKSFVNNAFSFAIVRNPFTRAQSLYSYLKRRNRVETCFQEFLERVADDVEPVGLYNSLGWSQANPQSRWVKTSEGKVLADKFWKLEELETALPQIREATGASSSPGLLNKSTGSKRDLSPTEVKLIQEIYKEDFDTFEYPLKPPAL